MLTLSIIIAVPIIAYIAYALLRPLETPKTILTPPVTPALVKVNIPWPRSSPGQQSAYGAYSYGFLASSNTIETPAPTASIAKVITAMAVLKKHPLKPGEQGPTIALTAEDVALYNKYISMDGSVVPVAAGGSMTQYQALQALLLPSANNIADTLVKWAFGSMESYTAYANSMVRGFGMNATTVSDASGFSKLTVSTAPDLVKLGSYALADPVMKEIVNTQSADFPGYGTIKSTNKLLGTNGIRGIKTGNTDEAGGCFLGAAEVKVGNETILVITAVLGAPDLATAMRDTVPLIQSTPSQFQTVHAVRPSQEIGKVTTAWGASSPIIANDAIDVVSWTGSTLPAVTANMKVVPPAPAGSNIGDLELNYQDKKYTSDLTISGSIPGPSVWWRLTNPR